MTLHQSFTLAALAEVHAEREAQDKKWGDQFKHVDHYWFAILSEEVGELAKAIVELREDDMTKELVQAAAVCVAWLEARRRRGL